MEKSGSMVWIKNQSIEFSSYLVSQDFLTLGNSSSPYFSTILNGNLNLSVALVILSTMASPLTIYAWMSTFGTFLTKETNSARARLYVLNFNGIPWTQAIQIKEKNINFTFLSKKYFEEAF
jgi:hypothetical protein